MLIKSPQAPEELSEHLSISYSWDQFGKTHALLSFCRHKTPGLQSLKDPRNTAHVISELDHKLGQPVASAALLPSSSLLASTSVSFSQMHTHQCHGPSLDQPFPTGLPSFAITTATSATGCPLPLTPSCCCCHQGTGTSNLSQE